MNIAFYILAYLANASDQGHGHCAEVRPHTHCANRTPHLKLKKVHTRIVNRTLLWTIIAISYEWEKKFKIFLELLIHELHYFGSASAVHVQLSAHLWNNVQVRERSAHQNEACAWSLANAYVI